MIPQPFIATRAARGLAPLNRHRTTPPALPWWSIVLAVLSGLCFAIATHYPRHERHEHAPVSDYARGFNAGFERAWRDFMAE
jgi:hypothetical protein